MTAAKSRPWIVLIWRALLLGLELCGAGMILWLGVPFYRDLLAGDFNQAAPTVKVGMTVAIILIQLSYWLRYRYRTTRSLPQQILLGHALMFLARLNFIFAGGVFSAVFFARYEQVNFSLNGTFLLFGILFSMFCVTLDIESIGADFLQGKVSVDQTDSTSPTV